MQNALLEQYRCDLETAILLYYQYETDDENIGLYYRHL